MVAPPPPSPFVPFRSSPSRPVVVLLGAPHTGAQALALALALGLQQRVDASPVQITDASPSLEALFPARPDRLAPPTPAGGAPSAATAAQACRMAALITQLPTAAQILLMGLDLPCPPQERPMQEAIDAQLRAALESAGVPYRVVYGRDERRINNALNAIQNIALQADVFGTRPTSDTKVENRPLRLRAWDCEKCSNPECEHRLFTALMDHRRESRD